MSSHKNTPYLKHILEAISDTEHSLRNLSKRDFEENKDVKDATIRRIEVIGEAVKNISNDFKTKHPEVEWKKIAGLRDILIHEYFGIDLNIVWDIIINKIPKYLSIYAFNQSSSSLLVSMSSLKSSLSLN